MSSKTKLSRATSSQLPNVPEMPFVGQGLKYSVHSKLHRWKAQSSFSPYSRFWSSSSTSSSPSGQSSRHRLIFPPSPSSTLPIRTTNCSPHWVLLQEEKEDGPFCPVSPTPLLAAGKVHKQSNLLQHVKCNEEVRASPSLHQITQPLRRRQTRRAGPWVGGCVRVCTCMGVHVCGCATML